MKTHYKYRLLHQQSSLFSYSFLCCNRRRFSHLHIALVYLCTDPTPCLYFCYASCAVRAWNLPCVDGQQLSNVALMRTHKTGSTTLATLFYRYGRRHGLEVRNVVLIVLVGCPDYRSAHAALDVHLTLRSFFAGGALHLTQWRAVNI